MQPLHCDLQPQIPKHPITTHTQAHPKQLEATVTMRQKKRQTDRSRNRRTDEVPFIAGCNHFTRKNARFRAPAFSRKQSPCNIMQPLCDLKAQIPKHPITTRHKHTQSSLKPPLQCGKRKRQTDRSRNRCTDEVPFIAGCSHFTRKNTRFRAPASSPKQSPCNIMQPFQCDLQAQFPKHPITTQTQAHPTQLEATVTMRQKKKANRPQPQPPHRRGTFHRRLQPLYTEKHKVSFFGFLPKTEPMQHHAAITMRSATTDSKTPYNYACTSTPKAA